ncbi:hypothetical protein ACYJ1Y_06845 [Natrialbaceae archaeon A-gly3]
MRRIYESGAVRRDDDEPFTPAEDDERREPQSFRSLPGGLLSRLLLTDRLREWAISVDVSTPREEYPVGSVVPFRVTLKNALPLPVTISTRSPIVWTWSLDGLTEASHVRVLDPPAEPRQFTLSRGERRRFTRRWDGMVRVSETEWVPAEPGEYTIRAELNVENPDERGLTAETTVRLV